MSAAIYAATLTGRCAFSLTPSAAMMLSARRCRRRLMPPLRRRAMPSCRRRADEDAEAAAER